MLDEPEPNVDMIVSGLENVILESSNTFKRIKRGGFRKTNNKWYDGVCKNAKQNARKHLRNFRIARSDEKLQEYIQSKQQYKTICKQKRFEFNKQLLQSIDANANSKSFWQKIKNILGKSRREPNITNEDWYDHFSNLFSSQPTNITRTDAQIDTDQQNIDEIQEILFNSDITDAEVRDAVHSLHVNKSVGGKLLPKHLLYGLNVLQPFIVRLFNTLFVKGDFPTQWTKILIVPVHKKGDANCPNNYRGIALIDVLSKVYISILTKRLTFYIDIYSKISECQSGFRSGYSAIDNAYMLYSIIIKYLSMKRKTLYVAFIDLQKAFDSVDHQLLYHVLQKNEVQGNLFKAIQSIYKSVKACVKTNSGHTGIFECPIGLRQGCNLSPILFALFIDELYKMLCGENIRGVQLFPDIVEIFLLMFADDIALIADTVSGLQKQLNILQSFCLTYKLAVNVEKSKVVVFKRGGRVANSEQWSYKGSKLDVVSFFTYVGMTFTNRLSLYKMAEATSCKAKKALLSLFNSLHQFSSLPYKTFFKLFDSKISSILLYGSELWGMTNMKCVEQVQIFACKRFLKANTHACNDAIIGDLGRYPMSIFAAKRCIRYWLRLLSMPRERYVRLCYEMLVYYDRLGYKNWVTDLKTNLYVNGFGYVWESQNVPNEQLFITEYLQRLKDQYMQTWRTSCFDKSKLKHYVGFKHDFIAEKYIYVIDIAKFRTSMANFRSSSHCLMIEKGRHYDISREFRTCPYCESCMEDEFHFILVCPLYKTLREKYIPDIYTKYPSVENFYRLMSSIDTNTIRNCAMYIYYAFKERNNYLEIFE